MKVKYSLILVFFLSVSIKCCHYSCSECVGTTYTQCTQCNDASNITILNQKITTSNQQGASGICGNGGVFTGVNGLGIALLVLSIFLCVFANNEDIFYLALTFQSFGLFALMQINWQTSTGYILDAFSYFMVFSKIGQLYKPMDQIPGLYKSSIFFHTVKYTSNISIIGVVVCVTCVLLIVLPIFKIIRKKINNQRYNCLKEPALEKAMMIMMIIFLFTTQEMTLIIFLSYGYGGIGPLGIASSVIYILFYLYFFISAIYKPLSFFRSKLSQGFSILKRFIPPMFILCGATNHYFLLVFLFLFALIDIILTHKNKENTVNKVVIARIIQIIILGFFIVQYSIQIKVNNQKTSYIFNIFSTILLALLIYPLGLELFLLFKSLQFIKKFNTVLDQSIQDQQRKVNSEVTQIDIEVIQKGNNNKIDQYIKHQSRHIQTREEIVEKLKKITEISNDQIYLGESEIQMTDQTSHPQSQELIVNSILIKSEKDSQIQKNEIQIENKKNSKRRQQKSSKAQSQFFNDKEIRANKRRKLKNEQK